MSQKDYDMNPRWYVVHTYSGYENKVKTDLEKTIKNRELEEWTEAQKTVAAADDSLPKTHSEETRHEQIEVRRSTGRSPAIHKPQPGSRRPAARRSGKHNPCAQEQIAPRLTKRDK